MDNMKRLGNFVNFLLINWIFYLYTVCWLILSVDTFSLCNIISYRGRHHRYQFFYCWQLAVSLCMMYRIKVLWWVSYCEISWWCWHAPLIEMVFFLYIGSIFQFMYNFTNIWKKNQQYRMNQINMYLIKNPTPD